MPFVQGAQASVEEEGDAERVAFLTDKCVVLATLFERIVQDEAMIRVLNQEFFWKNLDSSLLLLQAFKNKFEDLNLLSAYEMLVTTVPQLNEEGI